MSDEYLRCVFAARVVYSLLRVFSVLSADNACTTGLQAAD